jgi:hypothetical protein
MSGILAILRRCFVTSGFEGRYLELRPRLNGLVCSHFETIPTFHSVDSSNIRPPETGAQGPASLRETT